MRNNNLRIIISNIWRSKITNTDIWNLFIYDQMDYYYYLFIPKYKLEEWEKKKLKLEKLKTLDPISYESIV